MAEIHIEKKERSGMGWLWAVLALLAVVLIAWWLWPTAERGIAELTPLTPMTTTSGTATAAGTDTAAGIPTIATAVANPQAWVGRQFSGTVEVTDVPDDRGFWVEQDGSRMYALIIDQPAEKPVDINAGQRLEIREATFRDATHLPDLKGVPLTPSTERVVREQPIYLVLDETDLTIVDRPA